MHKKQRFYTLPAFKNKELIHNNKTLFCEYERARNDMPLTRAALISVSVFDHWLSFEEAQTLLFGWKNLQIEEDIKRNSQLSNFINDQLFSDDALLLKYKGRRNYLLPAEKIQFCRFAAKEDYINQLRKIFSLDNISGLKNKLYFPKLNAILIFKKHYTLTFFTSDLDNFKHVLSELAQKDALHFLTHPIRD